MSTVKRIAKNSAWQLISNIFQKIFSLIIVFILAKKFGVDNFGLYSFAFSFVATFSIMADFGINNLLVREMSKLQSNGKEFLSNALAVKILLTIVSFSGILFAGFLFGLDSFKMTLIVLAGISLLLDSIAGLFRGLFYSFEIFRYETYISFIYRLILLVLSLIVFFTGLGLIELLFVAVLSSFVNLLLSIYYAFKHTITPSLRFSIFGMKSILISAMPFFFIGLMMSLFANMDVLLLQKFWSQTEVGIYSAAVRLVSALSVVSVMFMNSVHPVATKFFSQNNESINTVVTKSLYYLTVFIFPVAVGTAIISSDLVLFFYDKDFSRTALPLTILGFTQIFSFANHVFITMLYSVQKEKEAFKQVFVSTIFNLSLNLFFLIPMYAENGAAAATFLSEILSFLIGFYFISKYVTKLKFFSIYTKPTIASILMGIFTFYIYPIAGVLISIILAVPVYLLALFLIKAFSKEDIFFFKKFLEIFTNR